jgi:hypothetical protein
VKNRDLCNLLQDILPTQCVPLVITEMTEQRVDCLQVKINSRADYAAFHELTQNFAMPNTMTGLDRMTGVYMMRLTHLDELKAHVEAHKEAYKTKAKKILSNFVTRELNSFLRRNQQNIPEYIFSEIEEALASTSSLDLLVALSQTKVRLESGKNISPETIASAMRQLVYQQPLLSNEQLRPLQQRVDDLEASLSCCCIFPNYYTQTEYTELAHLLKRLKKPFIDQTAKQLIDAVKIKLDLANTYFRKETARLLDELSGPEEEKLTQFPADSEPLLAVKHAPRRHHPTF